MFLIKASKMLSIYCIHEDNTIIKRFFPICVFAEVKNRIVNTHGKCSTLKTLLKHGTVSLEDLLSGKLEVKFNVHLKTLEMIRDIHYDEFNEQMLDYYVNNKTLVNKEFKQIGNFGLFKLKSPLLKKYRKFMDIIKSSKKFNTKEYPPKEFNLYNNVFNKHFDWNHFFIHYYSKDLFPYASCYYTQFITHEHLEIALSRACVNKFDMEKTKYENFIELCSFMFSCY